MSESNYRISTPENVDLHLELAGIGNRILAAVVDTVLSYLIVLLIVVTCVGFGYLLEPLDLPKAAHSIALFYVIASGILASFIVLFGYFIFFEGIGQGQTPGKKLAGIRVLEANGQPVSWSSVWIRNLIRVFDTGFALVGLVAIFIDGSERRFGDMAAGTIVIRERHPEAQDLPLKLTPGAQPNFFVDIGKVTPDEYELLLSFLTRREQLSSSQRPLLAHRLEEYFRRKIQPPASLEAPELFLEKLLLAYQQRGITG